MYLGNATHYREMENKQGNTVQGDKLECKIPYFGNRFDKLLEKTDTFSDLSLMRANTFICCMYALKGKNIVAVGENWIAFSIDREHEKIREFGDHALVICGVDRFAQSFESAEIDCEFRLQGYVDYRELHNFEIANSISDEFISYLTDTNPTKAQKTMMPFELIKDIGYEYQQEYRFVVHTGCSPNDTIKEYQGKIETKGIKINMENCISHSFICPTEDILSQTLCLKWGDGKFEAGFLKNEVIS